jgi:hypothetical protein
VRQDGLNGRHPPPVTGAAAGHAVSGTMIWSSPASRTGNGHGIVRLKIGRTSYKSSCK